MAYCATCPLLKSYGFNMIKIQEHWSADERREGEYDFSRVELVVKRAGELDLGVYLGLTMEQAPAWVWRKYPDCHFVYADGRRHNQPTQYTIPMDGKPGPCWDHPGRARCRDSLHRRAGADAGAAAQHLGLEYFPGDRLLAQQRRQAGLLLLPAHPGALSRVAAAAIRLAGCFERQLADQLCRMGRSRTAAPRGAPWRLSSTGAISWTMFICRVSWRSRQRRCASTTHTGGRSSAMPIRRGWGSGRGMGLGAGGRFLRHEQLSEVE